MRADPRKVVERAARGVLRGLRRRVAQRQVRDAGVDDERVGAGVGWSARKHHQ